VTPSEPAGLIEVAIGEPDELFERLDRKTDRHLAERVERFIVHQAEEKRVTKYTLVLRIAGGPLSAADEAALGKSIGRHFAHLAAEENARTRALMSAGRRDLAVGLLFLFVCGVLALFAVKVLPAAFGIFVEQGLLILGWVALWRPVDMFLYELRPLRHSRDLFLALSMMNVQIDPGS
jgi:hypothetical protein